MEFFGARLSSCSSIQYLGSSGLVYYSSKTGDSYTLQMLSEEPGPSAVEEEKDNVNPSFNGEINDRPFIRVIEQHQSLAPIIDMQLRDTFLGAQQQNELLIVSGQNYTSHINIIRKGISIKDKITLDDIPSIQSEGGLNCVGNKLIMRIYGIPQLVVAKLEMS